MNSRIWILAGVFVLLILSYVVFFTDWVRPAPIQIVSQVRESILQPRFGRPLKDEVSTNVEPGRVIKVETNQVIAARRQARRVRLPYWGEIGPAAGGVANVTFSLDDTYVLTALRVQDVPMDGSASRILWSLKGKSAPTRSLLYGRVPQGMEPTTPGAAAEPLMAGVPYHLIVEAGRRRGTNAFQTKPAQAE